MKTKLFGRQGRDAQLQALYRRAEHGEDGVAADPELQRVFVADLRLMEELGNLAQQSAPVNPSVARATLLAAVASQRNEASRARPRSTVGRLLTGRALALLATVAIFAGGAATVGASSGASNAASNMLGALHITDQTTDQADAPGGGMEGSDGAGSPTTDGTKPAVAGIPTENPQHQPPVGACDDGGTTVKATPTGADVNVPCTASPDRDGGSDTHDDKTPAADETHDPGPTKSPSRSGESADKTPDANATEFTRPAGEDTPEPPAAEPHDGSGEAPQHTATPLPRQETHQPSGDAGTLTDRYSFGHQRSMREA